MFCKACILLISLSILSKTFFVTETSDSSIFFFELISMIELLQSLEAYSDNFNIVSLALLFLQSQHWKTD